MSLEEESKSERGGREGRQGAQRKTGNGDLVDVFAAAGHEVHEEVVAEGLRRGEVGLAAGLEDALGYSQTFTSIRIVRADLDAREL